MQKRLVYSIAAIPSLVLVKHRRRQAPSATHAITFVTLWYNGSTAMVSESLEAICVSCQNRLNISRERNATSRFTAEHKHTATLRTDRQGEPDDDSDTVDAT